MTEDEFIKNYCERSEISWEKLRARMIVLPCGCGDESCSGFAMVANNELSIKTHMDLYSPTTLVNQHRGD